MAPIPHLRIRIHSFGLTRPDRLTAPRYFTYPYIRARATTAGASNRNRPLLMFTQPRTPRQSRARLGRRGVATIEFAVSIPVVLILVAWMWDLPTLTASSCYVSST